MNKTLTKAKVYIVHYDGIDSFGEPRSGIVGVYSTKDQAAKALTEKFESHKAIFVNNESRWDIDKKYDSYSILNNYNGSYIACHITSCYLNHKLDYI